MKKVGPYFKTLAVMLTLASVAYFFIYNGKPVADKSFGYQELVNKGYYYQPIFDFIYPLPTTQSKQVLILNSNRYISTYGMQLKAENTNQHKVRSDIVAIDQITVVDDKKGFFMSKEGLRNISYIVLQKKDPDPDYFNGELNQYRKDYYFIFLKAIRDSIQDYKLLAEFEWAGEDELSFYEGKLNVDLICERLNCTD